MSHRRVNLKQAGSAHPGSNTAWQPGRAHRRWKANTVCGTKGKGEKHAGDWLYKGGRTQYYLPALAGQAAAELIPDSPHLLRACTDVNEKRGLNRIPKAETPRTLVNSITPFLSAVAENL